MPGAVDNAWTQIASGQADRARDALRRHLVAKPRDGEAALALAHAHLTLGELPASIANAQRAATLLPGRPEPLCALAAATQAGGSDAEADATFERALAAAAAGGAPSVAAAARSWSDALIRAFRQDDAVRVLDGALARTGDDPRLLLSLCYAINVAAERPREEERGLHERLARAWAAGMPAPRPAPGPTPAAPLAGRPLRVAILSSDLREHSCGYFLEGPLAALNRDLVTPLLYSTARQADAFTDRFRALGEWRECAALDGGAIAALARQDRVDLLLDANAWTVPTQAAALATPLVAAQATYLGYPHTTGLRSVGWRLVDAHTDPPGAEAGATEQLVRLPGCFVCFRPEPQWPEPRETPWQRGETGAAPTFGSFNNAAKLAPRVVALWSRLLLAVPGSRLLLKAPGLSGHAQARLAGRFAALGIGPERLEFAPFSATTSQHVDTYSRVDVALDPFPYHGTTTTCEALWMGVPVVTLAGTAHRARVGVSLLSAAGLTDFIAAREDDYVRLASFLARDVQRLRHLRGSLRAAVARSPLVDARAFADGFARALRTMLESPERSAG